MSVSRSHTCVQRIRWPINKQEVWHSNALADLTSLTNPAAPTFQQPKFHGKSSMQLYLYLFIFINSAVSESYLIKMCLRLVAVMENWESIVLRFGLSPLSRWGEAGGWRRFSWGNTIPAPRLSAALAVPGGPAGRPGKCTLHCLDRPRHGVQTHWTRRGRFKKKNK